jgi:putative phage-type endonuclease
MNDRANFIGGSDAGAVLGVSPWSTPYQTWLHKGPNAQQELIDPEREKLFRRGKRLEPVVLEMLLDEYPGLALLKRNARYADQEHGFLAAEIDAEVSFEDEVTNIEIKTVSPFAASEWGMQGTDEIPLAYAAQVLHGLMVTRRKLCIVAALIGADDLRIHNVVFDAEFVATMREREVQFWRDNVLAGVAPDPITTRDLRLRYPRDSGAEIEATTEIVDIVTTLGSLKTEQGTLHKRIEAQENAVKSYMGDAATLRHNGATLGTWKLQQRKAYAVEAGEFRVLRIK